MTLKEFYTALGGDYADVIERLHSEQIILKFLTRFVEDPIFDQLGQAMDEQNQKEAFALIHTFKGTAINMGLGNLAESAKQLTEAVRTEITPEAPALYEKLAKDYQDVLDGMHALQAKQS